MNALVVSAKGTFRALLEISLESAGFTTTSAVSSKDALLYLREHTPDLIVIDEEIKGDLAPLDLAWRVKRVKRLKDVPVIFTVTQKNERLEIAARMAKVDAVLEKPISARDFARFARRTIELHDKPE